MPPELHRADYAVSANVGRTIDATRQAVVDARSCVDWLQQQGYRRIGILGTSLGSCYAFLASAHDPRFKVNVYNHCSSYFADVVWTGLSTQHIRQGIEEHIDLDRLRDGMERDQSGQLHGRVCALAEALQVHLRELRYDVPARIVARCHRRISRSAGSRTKWSYCPAGTTR